MLEITDNTQILYRESNSNQPIHRSPLSYFLSVRSFNYFTLQFYFILQLDPLNLANYSSEIIHNGR